MYNFVTYEHVSSEHMSSELLNIYQNYVRLKGTHYEVLYWTLDFKHKKIQPLAQWTRCMRAY